MLDFNSVKSRVPRLFPCDKKQEATTANSNEEEEEEERLWNYMLLYELMYGFW